MNIELRAERKWVTSFYFKQLFPAIWAIIGLIWVFIASSSEGFSIGHALGITGGAGVSVLVVSYPLFMLWYRDEKKKQWKVTDHGLEIWVDGQQEQVLAWEELKRFKLHRNGITAAWGTRDYATIGFVDPELARESERKWRVATGHSLF